MSLWSWLFNAKQAAKQVVEHVPVVGNIYILESKEFNPFERDKYRVKVLENRSGWTQYLFLCSSSTSSLKTKTFNLCYKPFIEHTYRE